MASTSPWPLVAGAIVLAGGGGFLAAKLSTPKPVAEPAVAASAPEPQKTSVEVPQAHLDVMKIGVETVTEAPFGAEIEGTGMVASAPGGEAVVTAQAAGAITRMNKRIGDAVRAGEVLAQVTSRDAPTLAADRSVAAAKVAFAAKNLAREKSLFEQRVSPRVDYETAQSELAQAQAEARRASAAASTARLAADGRSVLVVSPIGGRITAQRVSLGAYVQPETEVFRIVDPRFVQVEAAIPIADAGRIHAGDNATLTAGTQVMQAVVRSVSPAADAQTRSATVVLTITSGGPPTPGQSLQVRIAPRSSGPASIVVADSAVQSIGGRDVVFVRTAKGFDIRPVVVAARSGGRVSLATGLRTGDRIASANAFLLKAEVNKSTEEEE